MYVMLRELYGNPSASAF